MNAKLIIMWTAMAATHSRVSVPESRKGAEIGYATAPEHSFEFGLKVILDGLERELALPETTRPG